MYDFVFVVFCDWYVFWIVGESYFCGEFVVEDLFVEVECGVVVVVEVEIGIEIYWVVFFLRVY